MLSAKFLRNLQPAVARFENSHFFLVKITLKILDTYNLLAHFCHKSMVSIKMTLYILWSHPLLRFEESRVTGIQLVKTSSNVKKVFNAENATFCYDEK